MVVDAPASALSMLYSESDMVEWLAGWATTDAATVAEIDDDEEVW